MNTEEAIQHLNELVQSDKFTVNCDEADEIYFSRVGYCEHLNPLQVIWTKKEDCSPNFKLSNLNLARDICLPIEEAGYLLRATQRVDEVIRDAEKIIPIRQKIFALVQYSQDKKVA